MGDYLTFDSRLFRSVVPLLINPGSITNDYLDGKRQRFIPPIRVFLFLSFIYFGLSFLIGKDSSVFQITMQESEEVTTAVLSAFRNNFNLIIFLYIPLFAFLVRLLFKTEKRKYYVNYFVYALHLFSLFFIVATVQILLFALFELLFSSAVSEIVSVIVQLLIVSYILIYSVVSLKRVFQKKYTILRFVVVLIISLFAFFMLLLISIIALYFMNA